MPRRLMGEPAAEVGRVGRIGRPGADSGGGPAAAPQHPLWDIRVACQRPDESDEAGGA